ncbi:MAG: hypothetical protein V7K27_10840 [Nostoc sp.]|uniref:hypothetical protein n=1 Tax=Nostoc sp. TaxID=1180 RepID=UPI002FF9ABFC
MVHAPTPLAHLGYEPRPQWLPEVKRNKSKIPNPKSSSLVPLRCPEPVEGWARLIQNRFLQNPKLFDKLLQPFDALSDTG